MIYVLDADRRDELLQRAVEAVSELEGVDLTMWLPDPGSDMPEAVIRAPGGGELRFAPGGELSDLRGERWSVDGDLSVLAAHNRGRPLLVPRLSRRADQGVVGAAL